MEGNAILPENMKQFCRLLPKVELHAHLNGSLSPDTLQKLNKIKNPHENAPEQTVFKMEDFSSLDECFKIFDIAHSLTITPEAVYIATCDVIKEFSDDNVIYLELRSTPRAVEGLMTKQEYIEAMIKALKWSEVNCPNIIVKLLISVNRKQGYRAAEENIKLAMELKKKCPEYIVGIDLSGDPTQGDAFLELLKTSEEVGLKIAAHCAEVPNEIETMDILNFKPHRLGHCTCVHPSSKGSNELFDALIKSKIPVELCLSSNIKCRTVPSYALHHFKYLYDAKHPICISTDDKGVFNTSLSNEFEILSSTFGLKEKDLLEISKAAVNYAFATDEEKNKLLSVFDQFQ